VVPTKPRSGQQYQWRHRPNDPVRFPEQREGDVVPDIRDDDWLVVSGPSWITTRVRLPETPKDGPSFLVFTHHLRRR
jgi:hypothetical protein